MANQDAAFGLRANSKLGSNVNSEGTTEYSIASGASGNIFSGDPVKMDEHRYYFSSCCW